MSLSKKTIIKYIVFALVITLFIYFHTQFTHLFSLSNLQANRSHWTEIYHQHAILFIVAAILVYIIVTALALPLAVVLSLGFGSFFGLWIGLFITSIGSTLGSSLSFLLSRFLFQDFIKTKFKSKFQLINEQFQKNGASYLFTLRLVPVFPFFMVNLVMGLTAIRLSTFFLVSWIGMLPGSFVYVLAGSKLANIHSVGDIFSLDIILSFSLLGILPYIIKYFVSLRHHYKLYKPYVKPKKFDYNLVVLGAGSAGLIGAYMGSTIKAKVALIEMGKTGGDCLNSGCIPSKALLHIAKFKNIIDETKASGLHSAQVTFDFTEVMKQVKQAIATIEPHDSFERYAALGVDCFQGQGYVVDPYHVKYNDTVITTKNILIATGASPFVLPLSGLAKNDFVTSDTIWDLNSLPNKFIIIGAGPIGCELGQAFSRLGSQVTILEAEPQFMSKQDIEVTSMLEEKFKNENITIRTGTKALRIEEKQSVRYLICSHNDTEISLPFDKILLAVGRVPNSSNIGLEELNITINNRKQIETNKHQQTNFPNIFAAGDVTTNFQFTHMASHQATFAALGALLKPFIRFFNATPKFIPSCIFTEPEVAVIGLNETAAKEQNIEYEVSLYSMQDLNRAIAEQANTGFIKILTKPKTDKILGVTIVGQHAGETSSEFLLAMQANLGLKKIMRTMHIYPTWAEGNRLAAGVWQKKKVSIKLLQWFARFHQWQRKEN